MQSSGELVFDGDRKAVMFSEGSLSIPYEQLSLLSWNGETAEFEVSFPEDYLVEELYYAKA